MKLLTGSLRCLLGFCLFSSALAAEIQINPEQNLQHQIDHSEPGDHLILSPGIYRGNFRVGKPLTLTGEKGAVLDGMNQGNTLTIEAENVTVRHLEITNWGEDLTELNAGIFINQSAGKTVIAENRLYGSTFGIWVDATPDVTITGNRIKGDRSVRSPERGNGIHLYGVSGARVENNEVWFTRDGIYIETSNGNELINNYLHDLRYGVHYMYSYNNRIIGNHTLRTRTGYALMQSKFLTVLNNRSEDDKNYGLLMNFITESQLDGNQVIGVQSNSNLKSSGTGTTGGEGKAVFIYNSLFNEITNNLFGYSDLGIHLTAGSEDNRLTGNAFISNKEQVKYVATRKQDWSHEGRGNYWSDYLGWDMDNDGTGDTIYEPNDGIDKLLWKFPAAKVLMNSPAVETLRWVQRQFPVFRSPGVIDSAPLMASPFPAMAVKQ